MLLEKINVEALMAAYLSGLPRHSALMLNTHLQALADTEEEVDPRNSGPGKGCCAEGHPGSEAGFGGGVRIAGR